MVSALPLRPQLLGSGYAVRLPAFEGPLDLLLHLIETQELDISAISLVAVTDQYLQTLAQLEEIEPGALADFLVVASRLLYIKSYHLLPKPRPASEEDEEEAAGDALVRQLLEYRRFKEVASHLRRREEQGLRVYVRTAAPPEVPARLDVSNIDVGKLQAALRRVLQRMPVDQPLPRVKTYAITVAEQIANVRAYLRAEASRRTQSGGNPGVNFQELLSRSATRLEVIVTFLAILELVKLGEIEVVQDSIFAEIQLSSHPAAADGAVNDGAKDGAVAEEPIGEPPSQVP
jgi:segregation and condensation protein A